MRELIIKIITPWTLTIANVAIILAVELTDGGKLFAETGLIHGVAILFIFLAISILFLPYRIYDQYTKKFLWSGILAMLIFSASHVVEFLSYKVFGIHEDAVFANVAIFYIISILVMLLGTEMFFRAYNHKRTPLFSSLYGFGIIIFSLLVIFNILNDETISLERIGPHLIFYVSSVVALGFLGMKIIAKLKAVSIISSFIRYFRISLFFIIIAALINIFYVILEDTLGVPDYQVINIAHFSFYASLSGMMITLIKLSTNLSSLGGIYAAVREYEDNNNQY